MAYTTLSADEFGNFKPGKSEEEVVKLYNERVHKVILAWKNLHGLFENIQNDNSIKPLIDQGKSVVPSGDKDPSQPDLEREKHDGEEIKKRTDQVVKDIGERKDKEGGHTEKNRVTASALDLGAVEEVKVSGGLPQIKMATKREEERSIEKETGSITLLDVASERRQSLSNLKELPEGSDRRRSLSKVKELPESDLEQEKNDREELKKTAQVDVKELSERKVRERAAGKVKLIGALASELGDEVKMLKDQLQQVKLEKKQLEEKNLQKEKYIRSLVDERKQLLTKISKLSEELNALSAAHHFRTAELHYRPSTQASTSKISNKRTTPTKQ